MDGSNVPSLTATNTSDNHVVKRSLMAHFRVSAEEQLNRTKPLCTMNQNLKKTDLYRVRERHSVGYQNSIRKRLNLTRSSTDADKPARRDVRSGQSGCVVSLAA